MSNGPNIQGSVTIGTTSVDRAIKAVQRLEKTVRSASQKSSSDINKLVSSLNSQVQATDSASRAVDREAESVRNATQAKDRSVRSSQQLNTTMASSVRAINQVQVAQQKLEDRIRGSALEESNKTQAINQSRSAMQTAVRNIELYGNKSVQAAQGVANFRTQTTSASLAVANANRRFRGQAIEDFRTNIRNLTGSVQLALGPLSGIAARITALAGIFTRGGAAIAAVLAGFTAFTVSLTKGIGTARSAETQFLRTDSVIQNMGASARVTSEELFDMGASIAQATLLSASEAREAALALSNFGAVASDQFEKVVITAQGISEQMGGSLVDNTRLLGRVLQDPVSRMNDLTRRMGQLDRATRRQVEELALAGKRYEANEVLLESLSDKFDFATASAQGLDGGLDALGDMFNQFYEDTLLSSGGMEEATHQVNRFKDTIEELLQGGFGERLSSAYVSTIRNVGNAINFMAENAETLQKVLMVLAGGAAVRLIAGLGRMLAMLLPFGKAMVAATAGATSLTAALKGAASVITAVSAPLAALRVAAIVAGPALGLLAGRFIFSGEKAKEAETPIRDYNNTLKDLVSTMNDLEGVDPEFDETTQQFRRQAEQLNALTERMETLGDVASQMEKEVSIPFANLANATSMPIDEIHSQLSTLDEDMSDTSAVSDELMQFFNLLDESVQTNVRSYSRLIVSQRDARNRAAELSEEIAEQESNMRQGTEAVDDFNLSVETSIENTNRLAESYDREGEQLRELERELANAKRARDTLQDVSEDSELYEGAVENLQRLDIIIGNIKSSINDLGDESDDLGLGSGFQSLVRQINASRRETEMLDAEFRKLQGSAVDLDNMRLMHDIVSATEQAADNISRLNSRELQEMARMLDVEAQFDVENVEDYRDAVTEAYTEALRTEMETQAASERRVEAQERLNNALEDEPSRIQEIANQRRRLLEDAAETGAGSETIDAINEQYQQELELLKKHTDELVNIRMGSSVSEIEQMREERTEQLREMYAGEEEKYEEHLKRMEESAQRAKVFAQFVGGAEVANEALQNVMTTMEHANRDSADSYKRMAIMQATVAGALGIAKVWGEHGGNPILATALSGLVATSVGAQYAAINNAEYASGGYVSGKGTSTSDSIPASLSNGEYVINAAAVRKLGMNNLDAMNSGQMPVQMKTGGMAGNSPFTKGSGNGNGGNVSIQIIDKRSNDSQPVETEEGFGPDGERRIRVLIRDTVREQMQSGEYDRQQKNRYNNKPRAKRR